MGWGYGSDDNDQSWNIIESGDLHSEDLGVIIFKVKNNIPLTKKQRESGIEDLMYEINDLENGINSLSWKNPKQRLEVAKQELRMLLRPVFTRQIKNHLMKQKDLSLHEHIDQKIPTDLVNLISQYAGFRRYGKKSRKTSRTKKSRTNSQTKKYTN